MGSNQITRLKALNNNNKPASGRDDGGGGGDGGAGEGRRKKMRDRERDWPTFNQPPRLAMCAQLEVSLPTGAFDNNSRL